jgi:hypothetical protein
MFNKKKKLTKLKIFLFLNNKNKNRYMHIYRQSDRQVDINLSNVKMHRKKGYII